MRWQIIALIVLLACCWGPSFLFIKLAVGEIPPMTLVACRVAIGAVLLWTLLQFLGHRLYSYRRYVKHFMVMGFVGCALPFFLITSGEQYISSSMASILNSTTPIWTAVFAHVFIAGEQINWAKGCGVLLGFLGVVVVFAPHLIGEEARWELGALLVAIAAISYAVSMVYSKLYFKQVPPLVGATGQLFCAALIMGVASWVFERPYELPVPSWKALSSLLALSCLGTALAFPVCFKLAQLGGATILSTSALLFPVVGVFLGVMVLNEQVAWTAYLGTMMILCSVVMIAVYKNPPSPQQGTSIHKNA